MAFDGADASRLSLAGLGRALGRAATANPEMAGRADVLRFLNRWPRYADLERYLRVDNATFAETVARGLLENDPQDPPALAALAILAARRNAWPEAHDYLERALVTAPSHALTRLQRALARAATGETEAALDELRGLERRPRVQSASRFWRYEVEREAPPEDVARALGAFHGLMDEEDAREVWGELTRAFPENPEVLYTEAVRPDPGLAEERRQDLLRRALAAEPRHQPARVALAFLLRRSGRAEEALALVDGAPRTDREDPLLTAARGGILEQLGRRAEALIAYRSLFDQPLALLPDDALRSAGEGLSRIDDLETARRLLEDAAEARPGDPLCPLLLARLDARLDGSDAAERRLRLAGRDCGPAPALQYALGDLLRRAGRRVEAEGLFKVLARRHPRSPWGHRGLGDLAVETQPAAALEHYARATAADPWTPIAGHDYLRGVAALRAGDPGAAERWFMRGVAAESDNPRLWCDLGAARFHAGDLEGALEATRRALEIAPDHAGFLHNLAVYHRERFRRDPWRNWRSLWTAWRLRRRAARAPGAGRLRDLWYGPAEEPGEPGPSGREEPSTGGSPPV
jgi:tetratricopeptide (TPR) repeat protein